MDYSDLERLYGTSPSSIARAIGVSPQLVTYWKRKGYIPKPRQALIQLKTRGRLRADTSANTEQAAD